MAGTLFHSVTAWKPMPMEEGSPFTPGCIGHVFFFPKKSYRTLKGKRKGWARQTCGGALELNGLGLVDGGKVQDCNA